MEISKKFNSQAGSKFARMYHRAPRYGDMVPILAPGRGGKYSTVYAVKGQRGWYKVKNPAKAWEILWKENKQ